MEYPVGKQKANGTDILNWFNSGAREVISSTRYLNAINVFPVADGDTGSNLAATLRAMVERPVRAIPFNQMLERISHSGLMGARGNSGVIFASYISGLALEGQAYEVIGVDEFSDIALRATVQMYKAVDNPVEGTLISVIRDWAAHLVKTSSNHINFQELFYDAYQVAVSSLEKTKEQLAVLRKTHLVDSGAAGFVRFLQGINRFFSGVSHDRPNEKEVYAPVSAGAETSSPYRYCTEALLETDQDSSQDILLFIKEQLRPLGDSLIVTGYKQVKIHIHTDHPDMVMEKLQPFGQIIHQKADDMRLQESLSSGSRYSIGLVTDSIADLPEDFKLSHQIATLPLGVLIGQEEFLDKRTITLAQLFQAMEGFSDYPTTSQAEPGRVLDLLSTMLEKFDSLIVLSVSSHMSGTYQGFMKAAEALHPLGKRITVIDTKLNSGAQGLLVKKAAELIEAGFDHDAVTKTITSMIPRTKIYVCLNTLAYAVRGGRVPNTIGRLGMKIGLRPIMTIDRKGKGAAFSAAFSQRGLTRKIWRLLKKTMKTEGIIAYSIVHGGNLPLAKAYQEQLTRITGLEPAFISEISSAVAIHAGPGTVAVCFMKGRAETE